MFLEIQKEFLQHSPVQVITASNGADALQQIERRRPDLIFMDLEMPQMDGIECCRQIKSTPALAAIPVVIITARGDTESCDNCRRAGCDDFLTKPLDRVTFLETAARYLTGIDRRELRQGVRLAGKIASAGTTSPCFLTNLSVGGAFIATQVTAELERMVRVSFTLPDATEISCPAKVKWLQPGSATAPPGFGVHFLLPPGEAREALGRFVTSQAQGDKGGPS